MASRSAGVSAWWRRGRRVVVVVARGMRGVSRPAVMRRCTTRNPVGAASAATPASRTPAVAPEGWWSRLKPLLRGAARGLRSAGGVHQYQLGIVDRGDAEAVLAADRGAVARLQRHAVHLHPAAVGDQVAVAARPGE